MCGRASDEGDGGEAVDLAHEGDFDGFALGVGLVDAVEVDPEVGDGDGGADGESVEDELGDGCGEAGREDAGVGDSLGRVAGGVVVFLALVYPGAEQTEAVLRRGGEEAILKGRAGSIESGDKSWMPSKDS